MDKTSKNIVIIASILAASTIAIGAFGAHGLRELVPQESITSYLTGVRYQMYHVLGLFVLGIASKISSETKKWVSRFFYFGILFFSCSLYLLAIKSLLSFDVSFLGPVTPIGGLLFMIGWLRLAYGVMVNKSV